MRENPVEGSKFPLRRTQCVRWLRRIGTKRYEKSATCTRWKYAGMGNVEKQRSYLSELLDIVNGTGRRISAVCQLRYEDIRLAEGPYGSIRWPADLDKEGRESCVPINPNVRRALDQVLRDRPGIGSAPLFPKPTDRSVPLTIHLASKWLREGEKLAGLQTQKEACGTPTVGNGSQSGSIYPMLT